MVVKNKKGMSTVDFTVLLILGVLLLAVALIIVYKPKIVDYFRNLPIDIPLKGKDTKINADDPDFESICPFVVGRIYVEDHTFWINPIYWIKFCKEMDNKCLKEDLVKSDIYYKGNEDSAVIYSSVSGGDKEIGKIENGKFKIEVEINNEQYAKLNEAFYLYGNLICRKNQVSMGVVAGGK